MIRPLCSEDQWRQLWGALPSGPLPQCRPILVISPHPDDETLSVGGFLAACASLGAELTLLAVTDGESAYGYDSALGAKRAAEQVRAAGHLGISSEKIVRLRLPDSQVTNHEAEIERAIASHLKPCSLLMAPWSGDFHPDHKVCGRAAEKWASRFKIDLLSYFFWTWHTQPVRAVSTLPLRRFDLSPPWIEAKQRALAEHRSQLVREHGPAILTENLLWPARQAIEVFLPS